MAVRMRFDASNNVIQPTFALSTRNGTILGFLSASDLHIADNFNSSFEIIFTVSKFDNGVESQLWNQLKDFRLLYCPEWNVWFELHVEIDETNSIIKHVSGVSLCEAELSQVNLFDVEINTENDIARDDYKPTVLFNEEDIEASLLNRLMYKIPHYTIGHVDASIAKIQRVFTFDDISIYDAFQEIAKEINCIFVFDSGMNDEGKIARTINVYDLESYCLNCGKRGDFIDKCSECGSTNIVAGYGEDTNIFVSTDNLADGITLTPDKDAVKNCFKLEAGDELMTATLVNCNPNGSGYIWHISDETKKDMSPELADKITQYDSLYENYQKQYEITFDAWMVSAYNSLVSKYHTYKDDLKTISGTIIGYPALMKVYYDTIDFYVYLHDELMPSIEMSATSATEQAMNLTTANLSPVAVNNLSICSTASANSAVLAMAKTLIYSDYQVKITESQFENGDWSGVFVVTNIADEEDTYTTGRVSVTINDDSELYIKQQIEKVINKKSGDAHGIKEIFALNLNNFSLQIKKYCLTSLVSFMDVCQSCLDVLIQHGVADESHFLYNEIYLNYYNKLMALQQEVRIRESEIEVIAGKYDSDNLLIKDGIQTAIVKQINEIQDALNFENYIGSELWHEFCAYRREDTYTNENFISDGLDNRALFNNALQFLEVAQKEIIKASALQYSISANLKNLLVMKEFQPIVDYFKVGNWIHIMINNEVYRLRLIHYEVHYDDLESIEVEFSDVMKTSTGLSDSESILDQAASMASSYDSVKRQADNGNNGNKVLSGWVRDGLALTKMKIIDNADFQNITWDEHGLLCREYLPITETYSDKQLKIINRGLYLTDDNWRTSKAGIGNFIFYDPSDGKEKEAYGVIAETLVGNLILSEKVGIYNKGNSIILDENGFVLTTNGKNVSENQKVFTIRRKDCDENGVETLTNLFFVDNDGNLTFSGTLKGANGDFTGDVTALSLTIKSGEVNKPADEYFGDIIEPVQKSLEDLIDTVDGETDIYYSETEPTTINEKDIWYSTSSGKIMRYTKLDDGQYKWVDITNTTLGRSLRYISDAQATADGKIRTFAQDEMPTGMTDKDVGDLWIDTNDENKLYRWNGTGWVEYSDKRLDYLIDFTDGKVTIHYSTSEPTNPEKHDIWYNTSTNKIFRYDGSNWVDITSTQLGATLKAAGDAQATADGKIRTFAQDEMPTGMTDKDVGDLWIDTNDENKLYRWNGTGWVEYRDLAIADAQKTANEAQRIAGEAQTTANDAKTVANSASSAAKSAREFADSIYNGVKGIYFTNPGIVEEVKLSKEVGLKITGKDKTYFQVNNSAMGFFRSDGTAMLYYENGSLTLSGIIAAHGGYIGGQGGWIIGTDCIYNGNASYLGASGGIFLGTTGISVGSAILMKPNGSFIIHGDSSSSDDANFVLKIVPESTTDGNTVYRLHLGNIKFDSSFILPSENGGTGGTGRDDIGENIGIYRVESKSEMETLSNVVNGDLCILKSGGAVGSYISGAYTTNTSTYPGYLPISSYKTTGHNKVNYFDITGISYWNISSLDGEDVSLNYARVGVGETPSGAAGLFVPLSISSSGSVSSITITFRFATWPAGAYRDRCHVWENGINISLYRGGNDNRIASTTYMMPSGWRVRSSDVREASVTLSVPSGISSGEYYVAFYTRNEHSLMWIVASSVSIAGKSIGSEYGLYMMTGNIWKSIASSEDSGVSYILPAATSTALGGVKIGDNISCSEGVISIKAINVINALGYIPFSASNIFYSDTLPSSGVNGQICLVPAS